MPTFKLRDERIIIYFYDVVDDQDSYNAGTVLMGKRKNMVFKY